MASPNSTTYERPDIGQAFEEFPLEASRAGFVGLQVAPVFEAAEQTGVFPRVPAEALLEERETKRAPKAGYSQGDWEFEQDSYATEEHGAEELIDERQMRIYAYALDYEMICAKRAVDIVLRRFERDVASAAQSTTNFGATAIAIPWDQPAAAVPIDDFQSEIETFKTACGLLPNLVVLTDKQVRKLRLVQSIRDQVKFSGLDDPKFPNEEFVRILAQMIGVERIVIGNAVRNSGKKGQAATFSNIWDNTKAGLYRVAMSADLEEICALRTFTWTGDGAGMAGAFETYYNAAKRGDVVRFRHERKLKVMRSECGRVLTGALSA